MLTLIDILWILLQWIIALLFTYVVSISVIAQLSIKYPILEKIVVLGLKLLPKLSKIIGKSLLNNMKRKIRITKTDASIHIDRAYPVLLFRFCIDSKAPIDFKPTELTACVYMASSFMGKIHWSEREKRILSKKRKDIEVSIDTNYEFDEVQDLKAESESWAYLFFTPTLDVFKSRFAWKWHLEVFLTFSSKLGDISKRFSLDFKIKSAQIESVKKHFSL